MKTVQNSTQHHISFVENGEELFHYLKCSGHYADETLHPFPQIILLDLNIPEKNGCETLKDPKTDHVLKSIPVIILTTSMKEKDVIKTYEPGVNNFIIKPVTYSGLVEFTRAWGKYWFEIAELPNV
ncbi:response regulator [Chitinophaga oryziterrae]|uniref:response regulator n=1 Tax=Chitinophaga oryziterrae TaxID=1031224 RepID=UPI001F117839|nr:response regulator [Chitinophaga oryziterrae]